MRRIGIDVGGTNTDAVLVQDARVLHAVKTPTTADVTGGIRTALALLLAATGEGADPIDAVMIGTTHFTNAVVQRRGLNRVAALRIGLPSGASLRPFVDWPADLAALVDGGRFMIEGGHEYDGRVIVPLDVAAIDAAASRIADLGITAVGITSVFSPLTDAHERIAADILRARCPGIGITVSSSLGGIGLLERENATLLNACLHDLARTTTRGFVQALHDSGIAAPLFLTQNDGTVTRAELAERAPVQCFASGPTNSMRGAAFLSGIADAAVVDVGGTTADIGYIRRGFPREANGVVAVGGVRTLFRMPDLLSLGLGGGTEIALDPPAIGPASVGFRLPEQALVFGGAQLTATDIAVAAGLLDLGDAARVRHLPQAQIAATLARMHAMLAEGLDRMKTARAPVPLLAVGGGSFLVPERMEGASQVVRVPHHAVANAVGAAIAQVSGEVDRVFSGVARDRALADATAEARARAVEGGADPASLRIVETEDIPLAYVPGNAFRVRVRVIGDVAQ